MLLIKESSNVNLYELIDIEFVLPLKQIPPVTFK